MFTRRQLIQIGGAAGAGMLMPWKGFIPLARASTQVPQTPLLAGTIPKYVDPLPHFAGNRVAAGSAVSISMSNALQPVLPTSMGLQTEVWAYTVGNGLVSKGPLYPAYTIEATRNVPTAVTLTNNLTNNLYRLLTVDQTLHWADPQLNGHSMTPYAGPVPTCVHLHGGEVPSASDGHPDSWFTPGQAQTGPAWLQGASNSLTYPNSQEAATLWFHDHTLGVTRLNVYAGLAGFYLLRDGWDTGVAGTGANFPAGPYEIEIVIQDRMFDTNGQWLFPDTGVNPTVHPFWIPEFFGDTIVVNGKTWPFLNVEPRRYRFRMLNGSNARFYLLDVPGVDFWQIGTDGGLLDAPVKVNKLLLAPGERADVIVDFAKVDGKTIVMKNSASVPFPVGIAPDANTGQIMQFRVAKKVKGFVDPSFDPSAKRAALRGLAAGALAPRLIPRITPAVPTPTRRLTLNEHLDPVTLMPLEVLVNNSMWDAPTTETPLRGTTEVWEIVNLTVDAHPIHLHLVQYQIINRQAFDIKKYTAAYGAAFTGGVYLPGAGPPAAYATTAPLGGNPDITPFLKGKPIAPDANENGWKDTVRMNPGEVTRIAVRFTPTDVPVGGAGNFPFDPSSGPGYVWHCHIIDHEDNEMMRPLKVT